MLFKGKLNCLNKVIGEKAVYDICHFSTRER